MSKNTNLSFLTDFLTADIVNSRVGINNASPQTTFDVTGTGKFSGILTLGSTISNGTYAYTLPSATGTLALTSDIPSVTGYVPYTGATQAVNLGYNSLSASFLRIDGAGPTLGSYLGFKHSTNVTTGADGYTSIYTFGTNTIAFKSVSGATTRDFSFSMASITPGVPGGRTYTLPNTDGTIALTSQIPANAVGGTGTTNYLPKFTGASTIGDSTIIDNGTTVSVLNSTYTDVLRVGSNSNSLYFYPDAGSVNIMTGAGFTGSGITFAGFSNYLDFNTNSETRMRLTTAGNLVLGPNPFTDSGARLQVSGTATFTSTVTASRDGAGNLNTNTTGSQLILSRTAGGAEILGFRNTGSSNGISGAGFTAQIISDGNNALELYTVGSQPVIIGTSATPRLTIASTGAATFSNSITTSGNINVNSDGIFINRSTSGEPYVFFQKNGVNRGAIYGVTGGGLRIFDESDNQVLTITGTNVLIGTTTDNGTKLRVNGTANIPILTHEPGYHGTKVLIYGPTSSTTINLPTEFPLMSLTTGNAWAVFAKYCGLTGSGGGSEAREFYISRNTSGTWSSPAYSLDANTGASLSNVSGSGENLVIATTSNAYFSLELTVMIR